MTALSNPFFRNSGAVPASLFVGRQDLLQAFDAMISRPPAGESSVWAVIGDRGQGKSSVREFVAVKAADARQSSTNLEWNQAADQSLIPVSRQLFARITTLPHWERWLERLVRLSGKVEGGTAGPITIPRLRLRPQDGKEFAQLVRVRLRGQEQTLVILLDEIGISNNATNSSLNFARDIANATGGDGDTNLLVILFVIRRHANEFLRQTNAPRAPRRFELDDFTTRDIEQLLYKTLPNQAIQCDPPVAGHVHALTGGRPDVTMALLLDTWDSLPTTQSLSKAEVDIARASNTHVATITVGDVDRAASHGAETLARVDGALADARALATEHANARPVLTVLGGSEAWGDSAHTRDEWLSAVKKTLGTGKKTETAFDTVWTTLSNAHVIRVAEHDRWEFRGRLLRTSLKRVASSSAPHT